MMDAGVGVGRRDEARGEPERLPLHRVVLGDLPLASGGRSRPWGAAAGCPFEPRGAEPCGRRESARCGGGIRRAPGRPDGASLPWGAGRALCSFWGAAAVAVRRSRPMLGSAGACPDLRIPATSACGGGTQRVVGRLAGVSFPWGAGRALCSFWGAEAASVCRSRPVSGSAHLCSDVLEFPVSHRMCACV